MSDSPAFLRHDTPGSAATGTIVGVTVPVSHAMRPASPSVAGPSSNRNKKG